MSEDQKTQAAVDETNVPAQQGTEATSAQDGDDLDTLLKQFDESKPSGSSEPAKPEQKAEAASDVTDASREVLAARDEIRNERFQRDLKTTIADVRGDMPSDLYDDDFMQAWIDSKANKDPRLANAWLNRSANPQKFKQVVGALGKEFAKKYGKLPDAGATEDREAVTAAVRGASTRAPEGKAPDYAKMTPGEFQREKEKAFGG